MEATSYGGDQMNTKKAWRYRAWATNGNIGYKGFSHQGQPQTKILTQHRDGDAMKAMQTPKNRR